MTTPPFAFTLAKSSSSNIAYALPHCPIRFTWNYPGAIRTEKHHLPSVDLARFVLIFWSIAFWLVFSLEIFRRIQNTLKLILRASFEGFSFMFLYNDTDWLGILRSFFLQKRPSLKQERPSKIYYTDVIIRYPLLWSHPLQSPLLPHRLSRRWLQWSPWGISWWPPSLPLHFCPG